MRGILTEDPGDLQIGDEIVTNAGSEMRYYLVEEVPRVSTKKTWFDGRTRYIAVKCRAAITMKTTTGINHYTKQPWSNTYKTYEFKVPDDNDVTVKVDLNYKQIYIVNRDKWNQ